MANLDVQPKRNSWMLWLIIVIVALALVFFAFWNYKKYSSYPNSGTNEKPADSVSIRSTGR